MTRFLGTKRRKTMVTVLVVLVVGAIASWSILPRFLFPPPATANQNALVRWIVLRDLRGHPRAVQMALVDRLQQSVSPNALMKVGGRSGGVIFERFRAQTARNAEVLKRVWFETRSEEYCRCGKEERLPFLRNQIDTLFAWTDALEQTAEPSDSSSALDAFFEDIEQWTKAAPPARQSCMTRSITDGIVFWLATSDLKALPMSVRRAIARRVAEQLTLNSRSVNTYAVALPLSPSEATTLQRNTGLLIEAWAYEQAERYANVASAEKDAFVDARLDEIQSWNLSAYLGSGDSKGTTGSLTAYATLLTQTASSSAQQNDPQAAQLRALLLHVQQRLLVRSMKKIIPSSLWK